MSADLGLLDVLGASTAGGAQRRVLGAMDERKEEIVSALRRAIPFLIRKSVEITVEPARLSTSRELKEELGTPSFLVPLATDPGGSRALIGFDAAAIGFILTGVLGGALEDAEPATELTPPQRAVLGGLADQLTKRLSDSFCNAGFGLRRLPASASVPSDAQLATVTISLGEDSPRRGTLAIAREALQMVTSGQFPTSRSASDAARVPSILGQAEIEVICELGRLRRTVSEVEALRVGDTIRLDTLVEDALVLHVQNHPILRGHPTTQGTRIAITVTEAAPGTRPAITVTEAAPGTRPAITVTEAAQGLPGTAA